MIADFHVVELEDVKDCPNAVFKKALNKKIKLVARFAKYSEAYAYARHMEKLYRERL